MLEIGILNGASLRMWRDYFPSGRIIGIDFDSRAGEHAEDRIDVHIGDQTDLAFLEDVARAEGPFDLVVDDGGHFAAQQQASLKSLWPHVKPEGIYVIEDIHTSYMKTFGMGWREPGTTVEFLKGVVDDIHQSVHGLPAILPDVESMHFYSELCVIRRGSEGA